MIRRTVKVRFMDYWGSFADELDDCLIMRILRKHYDVQICDDADYVFFSTMGESHWSVSDNCIKIYQTGENLVPDFNACDYAIGFEWMTYEDRYIRFPCYLFYEPELHDNLSHKHELPADFDLKRDKPDFCSFVVSNHRNPMRKVALEAISTYKRVESGGSYLNNIGGPVKDKIAFESTHKFSICYENGAHNGYTTEKLVQALAARTIPIYWGDPLVGKVFNTNAFINARDYDSIDDIVARVREIDNDDELYLSILRQPAMRPDVPTYADECARFEAWLLNIFEQPLDRARRRNRDMHGRWYIERRYRLDSRTNRKAIRRMRREWLRKAYHHILRRYFHKG